MRGYHFLYLFYQFLSTGSHEVESLPHFTLTQGIETRHVFGQRK